MAITKQGFCSGSDILMCVGGSINPTTHQISGGRIVGHSKSCVIEVTNSYQDKKSKPTDPNDKGIHKGKILINQDIHLSVSAFHFYDENNYGLKFFLEHVISGESFLVSFLERRDNQSVPQSAYTPFFAGYAVVESAPVEFSVGKTVSYEITLVADGKPDIFDASNLHNR